MSDDFDDLDFAKTLRADGVVILAGRYRVVRELGRGGMGAVYLATDLKLENRQVAIKVPPAVLARNPRAVQGLKQEALLAMQLSHPHIVTLRAFEEGEDGVFLVMDCVEGRTLEALLAERGTLSEEEILRLFCPVAEALDYAHSRRVVHRDVKPSNIMVASDGTPYIMDFGIAREMKDTYTRVTGKGTSGTLPYMSPEQLRGAPPAPAQDVYSLAATLYECLSGHPPFWRGQIEYQIVNEDPEPLTAAASALSKAVLRGLAKGAEGRPASCRALLKEAGRPARAAEGATHVPPAAPAREAPRAAPVPVQARPQAAAPEHPARVAATAPRAAAHLEPAPRRSHGLLVGFLVLAVLGLVVGLAYYGFWQSGRTHPEPERREPARVKSPPAVPVPPPVRPVAPSGLRVPEGCRPSAGSPSVACGGTQWAKQIEHEATGIEMVFIPAGEFLMGGDQPAAEVARLSGGKEEWFADERPQHRVTLTKPFYLGKHEVTQGEWQRVMGTNPSYFKGGDRLPVETVSWEECQEFCRKVGDGLRLPTEAQWEYACRAGATTPFHTGETISTAEANYDGNSVYGNGTKGEYRQKRVEVGSFKPNAWGLCDMHGNVWEWCADWYGTYPTGSVTDPAGPASGTYRVLRGGGWFSRPWFCRSALRFWFSPVYRRCFIGFGVALDLK